MPRAFGPSLFALFFGFGCGGATPPPDSPAPSESPASDSESTASPPSATPGSAKPGEDGWEGEAEATKPDAEAKPATEAKPPPDTKGTETRTVEVLGKIIKANRQPVRDCYEKARKDLPTLQGDIVIFFVLDPEGKIKKIELNQQASTLKSPAVVDCAIKVIRGLNFPPSSRGMETTVNYPYNFKP